MSIFKKFIGYYDALVAISCLYLLNFIVIVLMVGTFGCDDKSKDSEPSEPKGVGKDLPNDHAQDAVRLAAISVLRENGVKNLIEIAGNSPLICSTYKPERTYLLNYDGAPIKDLCGKIEFQSKNFFDLKGSDFVPPQDYAIVALGVNLFHGLLPEEAEILPKLLAGAKVIIIESPISAHKQNDQASEIIELAKTNGKQMYINTRISNRLGVNKNPRQFSVLK